MRRKQPDLLEIKMLLTKEKSIDGLITVGRQFSFSLLPILHILQSEALTALCFTLSFQGYLFSKCLGKYSQCFFPGQGMLTI